MLSEALPSFSRTVSVEYQRTSEQRHGGEAKDGGGRTPASFTLVCVQWYWDRLIFPYGQWPVTPQLLLPLLPQMEWDNLLQCSSWLSSGPSNGHSPLQHELTWTRLLPLEGLRSGKESSGPLVYMSNLHSRIATPHWHCFAAAVL